MDNKNIESFLKSVGHDFNNIKYEEDNGYIKLNIGNFFIKRRITNDIDYDQKKLFEDFLTNTTAFYIDIFWEQ